MAEQRVYPQDIECVFQGKSPFGRIFVSNVEAAQNASTLQMVTVAKGAFLAHDEVVLPNYLYIPADDVPEFQLAPYFSKSYDFIDRNLLRTNVYRVVAAYMVRKFKKSSEEAIGQIRRRRPIVNPNRGFIQQLKEFEISMLVQDRDESQALERKPRKMSDNTSEMRRSSSGSKLLFSPTFRQAKTSRQFEKIPEKESSQQQSTQPTLKLTPIKTSQREPNSLRKLRSLSVFQKHVIVPEPPATVTSLTSTSTRKPFSKAEPTISVPTTTSFKTQNLLMAKLNTSETPPSPSRLRETTKYDSYRFRHGQDLRSNILRYYKVQGFK